MENALTKLVKNDGTLGHRAHRQLGAGIIWQVLQRGVIENIKSFSCWAKRKSILKDNKRIF